MSTLLRNCWQLVVVAGLLAFSAAASAATYYVRVVGAPSSISCTNTKFTFGPGASFQWNLASTTSMVQLSRYINGVFVNGQTSSPGAISGSASGSIDLSAVGNNVAEYPSTPFSYTVSYVIQPLDPDTDGVSMAWTCTSGGGINFTTTLLPAQSPNLQASPGTLAFPAMILGNTSSSQTATINNTGTLEATGVTVVNSNTADFTLTGTTCGATIAVGASCTVTVVFHPTAVGPRAGTVTVNRSGGPGTSFGLTGVGNGQLQMQSPLVFSGQTVGTTSAAMVATVTNGGTTAVTVSSVTSSNPAEFTATTTCASVAAGAQCTISVTFKPTATGQRTGTITVTSTGVGSPQTITLFGTGVAPPVTGQLALPAALTFGTQTVAMPSAPMIVSVTNVGGSAVTVSSIQSSAATEFVVSGSTCAAVQAGAGCSFSVTFTPAAAGARSATITVTSDGLGSPQVINATGTGSSVVTPGQLALPATLLFGTLPVGTASAPSVVTVANTGGAPVAISGIQGSAEFAVSQTGGCTTLAPGAQCVFSVTFTPAAPGARSGTITVTSNGVGSPQTLGASGTGVAPSAPGQLSFDTVVDVGNAIVGTASPGMTVAVANVGGAPVQVASISSSNPSEFAIVMSQCGLVLSGSSCQFSFNFTPSALGLRTATITIVSDGVGGPQTIAVSGTGTATPPATVEIIEYYHAVFDHYFVTGIADEIVKLDNGTFVGWARTGLSFKAYPSGTASTSIVCRFFSTAFGLKSSHFYTPLATECAIVKANPDWQFEGEVFNMIVPDVNGVCPAGTLPVYRYYNNGQGGAPNHRYSTDLAIRPGMLLVRGWIAEGYGDLGVIMCAPL